jgi:hypothetical protein
MKNKDIPANGPGADQESALSRTLTELEGKGERTLISPTPCMIRTGITTRPSGRAALTTSRVIWQWRKESGEIPLIDVRSVAEGSTYNGETLTGVSWVVFACTAREIGIGFLTGEHTRWIDRVKNHLGSPQ